MASLKEEEIAQINAIAWFKYNYPEHAQDIHHFANERKLEKQGGKEYYYASKLKRMGVTKGVSDIFLAVPVDGYHGLWIEVKVGKGRLSKEQKEFLERKTEMGYMAIGVWGEDAIKEVLITYLDKKPNPQTISF